MIHRMLPCRHAVIVLAAACLLKAASASEYIPPGSDVAESSRGIYFGKKTAWPNRCPPSPLPGQAACPILDGRPEPGGDVLEVLGPRVPQHDAPPARLAACLELARCAWFNRNIFQWDSVFIAMFARYGNDAFPAIQTSGQLLLPAAAMRFIGREIQEDRRPGGLLGRPKEHTVNPPLFSWAEVESFRLTGDKSRFARSCRPLEQYVGWLNRDGDPGPQTERLAGLRPAGGRVGASPLLEHAAGSAWTIPPATATAGSTCRARW